ncbi:Ubiquinone/menaquinone biosynthesis C-methyltransferase UbiE [Planctomycetes bacterium Poly30]|uniref:Arsenite methyltransferase n=1 Tax=Saltatorellus ferox TaxID=2528018 RepID=A0A518EMH2_9BACT|nr:Ubiquinone/menaquinone biosynthesis C-methyltransferase UbiE [Planctomycetes bacterium Poly30]
MNTHQDTQDAVRKGYAHVAQAGLSSAHEGIAGIAEAFGYSREELESIPAESNMGLSCGNPVAMASIRPGETVLDLGSGGGLDVFLASRAVGPTGRAIGVDMTGEMVSLARANAAKGGYENVKFHLAEIEAMPLPDHSVDCVISNCVMNLCPDKDAALAEVYRVLKPGGRLAISDIALKKALPAEIEKEVAAWTGCIAGAVTIDQNRDALARAGFGEVVVQDAGSDLNAYREGGHAACCGPESEGDMSANVEAAGATACCAPPAGTSVSATSCCAPEPASAQPSYHETMGELLDRFDVNEYAASVKIWAVKA